MPQVKQNADASVGIQGTDGDDGPIEFFHYTYPNTGPLTASFGVLNRRMVVKYVTLVTDVASTNAVTVTVYKVPSGTAVASGTALHSGTGNLQGTINTNQVLTLSAVAGALDCAAGTRLGFVISGALGAAGSGSITVALCPA